MKVLLRSLILISALAVSTMIFIGCGKDPKPKKIIPTPVEKFTGVNKWIFDNMEKWYLWPEDVTAKKATADNSLAWDKFFTSLLSTKRLDGKSTDSGHSFYSYIERSLASSAPTKGMAGNDVGFGWEFKLIAPVVTAGSSFEQKVFVIITAVDPNSTAGLAGVKRGDLINIINGTAMTFTNYTSLYPHLLSASQRGGSAPATVTITRSTFVDSGETVTETVSGKIHPTFNETVIAAKQIAPASYNANAVHFKKVITQGTKKVGYLVYSRFETGDPTLTNQDYNNSMKLAFNEFKNQGVNEIVLDLRYNGGGYVSCSQLLTSILAPSSKLGTNFAKYQHNAAITASRPTSYVPWIKFLDVSQMSASGYGAGAGVNMNMTKIYVLCSGDTASASEMVINGMRGVDAEVILIGTQTEGKNVGMDLISGSTVGEGTYDGYAYSMHPITFHIYNAKEWNDYAAGFPVQHEIEEFEDYNLVAFKPFGDVTENLLEAALQHISTGTFPDSRVLKTKAMKSIGSVTLKKVNVSSIDFNELNGMLINDVKKDVFDVVTK